MNKLESWLTDIDGKQISKRKYRKISESLLANADARAVFGTLLQNN